MATKAPVRGEADSPVRHRKKGDEESQEEEPPAEEEEPAEDSYSDERDCVDGGGVWAGTYCNSSMDLIERGKPCSCHYSNQWEYSGVRTRSSCMAYAASLRRNYPDAVCVSSDETFDDGQ